MKKKHFIALAVTLREIERTVNAAASDHYVPKDLVIETYRRELGNFCAQQSPTFQRDRWLGYVTGENVPDENEDGSIL